MNESIHKKSRACLQTAKRSTYFIFFLWMSLTQTLKQMCGMWLLQPCPSPPVNFSGLILPLSL